MGDLIEILLLRAMALQAQGAIPVALAALNRALTLAAPEGYVRMFVDEGAHMAALLAQSAECSPQNAPMRTYAERLLSAFPEADTGARRRGDTDAEDSPGLRVSPSPRLPISPALVEPLSEREREVLRLIAAGLSNQAIADRLVVAISTVKKHVNNIYGKLDVQSRTQALVRARELHLL
jgi:LuxR family maltose regulon positive regulatory protein